jgi:hypothetical protein
MTKLIGTIRIRPNPRSDTMGPHFAIDFQPYSGRLNTQTVRATTYDELVEFLIGIRIGEDDATRFAGQARSQGVVLIPGIERTEAQLRDSGLLA